MSHSQQQQHHGRTVRAVTVQQNGQCVSLTGDTLTLFGGDLLARSLGGAVESQRSAQVKCEWQSLTRSQHGYRMANAGLLPALHRCASTRGIDLRIECRPAIVQLPQPVSVDRLDNPQLAYFARQHERGMIVTGRSHDPAALVRDLAVAYPQQRIVVLGDRVVNLQQVAERLTAGPGSLSSEVRLVHGRQPLSLADDERMPRVICATYTSAVDIEFPHADIVLVLHAERCLGEAAQIALSQIDARFRLFGILRNDRGQTPLEQVTLMRVFGPNRLDILSYGRTRRPASVTWVQHNQPKIRLESTDPNFWYRGVWHNERRNRVIARVAKATASGDLDNLAISPDTFRTWRQTKQTGRTTVILVDNLDHAVTLAGKLPGWQLVTGDGVDLRGYSRSIRARVMGDKYRWSDGYRYIVLADAARQWGGYCASVVIWAGAKPSTSAIPASWLAQQRDEVRPLWIVDFCDTFNAETARWSQQRRRHYLSRDIYDVGVDPVAGRVAQFLSQVRRAK